MWLSVFFSQSRFSHLFARVRLISLLTKCPNGLNCEVFAWHRKRHRRLGVLFRFERLLKVNRKINFFRVLFGLRIVLTYLSQLLISERVTNDGAEKNREYSHL